MGTGLVGLSFNEQLHMPFFHVSAVKRAGGTRTTPVLQTESQTLADSEAISRWIQEQPNRHWKPYGNDEKQVSAIQSMETELGRKLGLLSRLVAYHHLLPHKSLIMHCMSLAPDSEQRWFRMGYPLFAWLMRKGMSINNDSATRATQSIRDIFDTVESQSNGAFLIGDCLTIADVSLAALRGPLVLPDKYGAPLPSMNELPEEVQNLCGELREHPTGQRILRLYSEYR